MQVKGLLTRFFNFHLFFTQRPTKYFTFYMPLKKCTFAYSETKENGSAAAYSCLPSQTIPQLTGWGPNNSANERPDSEVIKRGTSEMRRR